MQYTILLSKDADIFEVEEEEKLKFLRAILEMLEVDLNFWKEDSLNKESKLELREKLAQLSIMIENSPRGEMKIYHELKPIAIWYKPYYLFKKDNSQTEYSKRIWIEMSCSFDSIFNDEMESSNSR